MTIPFYKPSPAPPGAFKGIPLPRTKAGWISTLFFHWITPILRVGYSRPLEAEDLWDLTEDLQCERLASALNANLQKRMPPSRRWHGAAEHTHAPVAEQISGEEQPVKLSERKAKKIAAGTLAMEGGRTYDMSLWKAIYITVWRQWWLAVTLSGIGSALKLTSPLVTRLIIEQLILAHDYHSASTSDPPATTLPQPPRSIGYGIGLAFALFAMEFSGALFEYQATQVAAVQGCSLRAAVVDLISRKSMRLSGKSRLEMTSGRLNTMVSSDTSFLDWAFPASILLPVQPVMIIAGIGLLVYTLGYSALVGLGILLAVAPFQGWLFGQLMKYRSKQEQIVDRRVRLLSEIINNIRSVKLYAYETFFGQKVTELRSQELSKLKGFGLMHALINSTFYFLPIVAAVLTFVVYSLTGNVLNPAIIFSALQFFNVLRQPISQLPMIIAAVIDAVVALGRIGGMLRADELHPKLNIKSNADSAIDVSGDFSFEAPQATTGKEEDKAAKPTSDADEKTGEIPATPFRLKDIRLSVPRGSLVCIVGRVGTGKSALLLGMINEMRQTKGHTIFGGTVSYVPQEAWVQSGSVKDNITFSEASTSSDANRTEHIIRACGLAPDIDSWDDREDTYIGEKGITLSGGQRQRICVARAAYADTKIVLLDDPLSALDANVGHHLLHHCILQGPLSKRTRVLVTHHLDVLPKADWIVVMDSENDEGRICQQGTYNQLLSDNGPFRSLIKEFGSASDAPRTDRIQKDPTLSPSGPTTGSDIAKPVKPKSGTTLMMDEERLTGEVKWTTYTRYFKAVGSWWWAVVIGFALITEQAATVGNSLMLGYWSDGRIDGFAQGEYMAVYAGFGLAVAIFSFVGNYAMILAGIEASFHLFNLAWKGVIRSPISWHDRTPSGRIISRLSKDVQMMDDRLAAYWSEFLSECLAVLGTFALVTYTLPWLSLAFIPLVLLFYTSAAYYRQTSRELKRLDSILRSHIYSSFGEQLSGLAVIRAFDRQAVFERKLQSAIDTQNQAYILSITCQRWLSVRLQFASQLLILLIAIFGTLFRNTVNPSQFGVVLTYALHAALVLTALVPLYAVCEQEMNNVERIEHYTDLDSESAAILPSDPPSKSWPTEGAIEFENVQLRYRPELPLVLKGVSFKVRPGEKVGIIGRTGAGKSSITQALFRMVEICGGGIWVDGRSIGELGLETLRSRVAIIPQDAFLFEGTVRDNVDPKSERSDAELNDLLGVIRDSAAPGSGLRDKFQLDAKVSSEGDNFSVGERQLLSLVRALSRRCKVLVLDEATSSVDLETDALIQRVIQTQLANVTLISIAHRLQTVAYYDRIIVMDQGRIVETGTPLVLYEDTSSLFRSLCDTKQLGIRDILKIRDEASTALLRSQRAARPKLRETRGRGSDREVITTFMDIPSVFARYF